MVTQPKQLRNTSSIHLIHQHKLLWLTQNWALRSQDHCCGPMKTNGTSGLNCLNTGLPMSTNPFVYKCIKWIKMNQSYPCICLRHLEKKQRPSLNDGLYSWKLKDNLNKTHPGYQTYHLKTELLKTTPQVSTFYATWARYSYKANSSIPKKSSKIFQISKHQNFTRLQAVLVEVQALSEPRQVMPGNRDDLPWKLGDWCHTITCKKNTIWKNKDMIFKLKHLKYTP